MVLISSGSEVALILEAQQRLESGRNPGSCRKHAESRIVREGECGVPGQCTPTGVKRIAIEAAHPMSWYRWVGDNGVVLGIERFGASAPYKEIYTHLGLTVDKLVEAAKQSLSAREAPRHQYTLAGGTPEWPGDTPYSCGWSATLSQGSRVNVSTYTTSPHVGTHADAPLHVRDGSSGSHELPLEAFFGRAMVVDVTQSDEHRV